MKKILSLIIVGLLSCSISKTPEKDLYDCWIVNFKAQGVDLMSEIQDFENDLIKNGYLKDSSYLSYKHLLDSLSNVTLPIIGRTILMKDFSESTFNVDKLCSDSNNVKPIPKITKMFKDFGIGTSNQNLGYAYIYSEILKTIDEKDFNNSLYKTWISWVLISDSYYSNWLKDILPKTDSSKSDMTIMIDSLENNYINDIKIRFTEIEPTLRKLKATNDTLKIGLKVDNSVSINKFVELMNLCNKLKIEYKLETNK